MNNSQTYEKIVKVKNTGKHLAKKVTLAMCYLLFFAFWLSVALDSSTHFAAILLAGVLSTLLLIIITWKYLQLEYEYAFWYGRMSVSRIYGKKKRKTLLDIDVKHIIMIAEATDENIQRAEHLSPKRRIISVSSENADSLWLAVTGEPNAPRNLVFFEADERLLGMLRSINPFVFVKN